MKISTRTRYGIRAMIEIAMNQEHGPVDLQQISDHQDISRKYLHALLVALKNNGLLTSIRGQHGGYILTRPAEEITMLDIHTVLDGPTSPVDCVDNAALCSRSGECVARDLWNRIGAAVENELKSTTLADMINSCRNKKNT